MKFLIFVLLLVSVVSHAEVTKTYYIKVLGNQKIGMHLLEKLSEKKCHGENCHAFKKFENNDQIKGDISKDGSSLLYQVNITQREGVGRYNLQIFQRDGKKLRRVRNAGNFTPQEFKGYEDRKITDDEFFGHLVESTVGVSFK